MVRSRAGRIPHYLIGPSPLPRLMGRLVGRAFVAWTFCNVTFVAGRQITPAQLRHEYRHVQQWAIVGGLWAAVVLALAGLGVVSWWWLAGTPLAFTGVYLIEMGRAWGRGTHPYRDNWFERDARRVAGEPV